MKNQAAYFDVNYPSDEYSETDYPQRLCNYIAKKYLNGFAEGASLLDIGCGKGSYLLGFSRLHFKVTGLDKTPHKPAVLAGAEIKECDLGHGSFPFNDDSFQIVFLKSVIEHVGNTDAFLREIYRVLDPSGLAIILTPAWESQYRFFFNDYTHVKPFTRKGMQNALRINGFQSVKVEYFLQLPFVWKYPALKIVPKVVALLPDRYIWRDSEETAHRSLVRFSKEKMLLATARKAERN